MSPTYHPELNPSVVKEWDGTKNVAFKLDDAIKLAVEQSADDWLSRCRNAQEREAEYISTEIAKFEQTQNIVINLGDDSETDISASSSDSEGEISGVELP